MGLAVSARNMIDAARRITKTETLDEANSFCTDTELLLILNAELAELDDEVKAAQDEDYVRAAGTITLEPGVSVYPLPVDAYKVTSIDVRWSPSVLRSAHRFTEAERNRFRNALNSSWMNFGKVWFRLVGDNIEFIPTPASAVTVFVNYQPSFAPLTAYTDTYQSQNGWHMAAVWGLAGYIAQADKDEEKAQLCYAQKERQLARVRTMAASRIDGEPPRIQRVRSGCEEDD